MRKRLRIFLAKLKTKIRFIFRALTRIHPLEKSVVISLTSYPPRFQTLHLTIQCLLSQSFQANRVELWVAREDLSMLPKAVLELQKSGLLIKACSDLRSYKKLIPALNEDPNSYIVTADDDVYYPRNWLRELLKTSKMHPTAVVCHRAHRIRISTLSGQPLPYDQWEYEVKGPLTANELFPTGVGGVLYPPGCLHPKVFDSIFLSCCPYADDLWFYWMARLNDSKISLTKNNFEIIEWEGTQHQALWRRNVIQRKNDEQIQNLINLFGNPIREKEKARPT